MKKILLLSSLFVASTVLVFAQTQLVVNAKSQIISVTLDGISYKQASGRILVSPHIQDHNTFNEPGKIKPVSFTNFKKEDDHLSITLPPASVVVITFN